MYGDKWHKTLAAKKQASRDGLFIRKWSGTWMQTCFWMNTHIGRWGAVPPSDSPGNVPPSHSLGAERGGMDDLPRPLAWPPALRPSGGCLHHPIGGISDL